MQPTEEIHMKHLTKLEIIQDFVDNFVKNPSNRAQDCYGNSCYLNDEGKNCAIGRWFTEDAFERLTGYIRPGIDDTKLSGRDADRNSLVYDDFLVDEVHGHHLRFWKLLEALHDTDHFWSSDGITPAGQDHYEELVADYE